MSSTWAPGGSKVFRKLDTWVMAGWWGGHLERVQPAQEHRPIFHGCSRTLAYHIALPVEPRPRPRSASEGQPGMVGDREGSLEIKTPGITVGHP